MNMIVNKSDLVGYEAVDTKAAKKEALAKLVAAWESKQARNARRFGGLGFLAVSLAACNSSDDDTTTTTTTTTTETTTPVSTAVNATLTDDDTAGVSVDVITGTSSADTIEATQATLDDTDVITDATSGDGDTLTVAVTTGNAESPSIVNGIENVTYNVNSFAVRTIDVANVYGANITVNNTQLGGTAAVTVNNLGNGSTLNLGTQTTGAITIVGLEGSATVNAGTGAITATAINPDGMTFNAVNGSSMTLTGDTVTSIATVNAATGAAVAVDAGDGVGNAISNLTLSGGGTFTIGDTAPAAYTVSGASGATIVGVPGMFEGLALTDSTTGGTVTLQLSNVAAGQTHNLDELLADVIEVTGDAASAGVNTFTIASGTTFTISDALTHGVTLDADAARTGAPENDAEVVNVIVGETLAGALDVSDFETITVSTTGTDAISMNALTAAATATVTLNGTAPLTLTAATADAVDASGYTGAITHTMAATADNITFGSGDDSVTFATGATVTVVGGAGNDTLIGAGDMLNVTFSGFELFTPGGAITNSDSSQFNGGSMIINGGFGITISLADTATIDLSGHTMAVAASDNFTVSGALDPAVFVASQALNITGSSGNDSLTGTANADTINGGAGDDTITGAAGADSITTGAGGDTIVALEGAMAAGTAAAAASTTGFDTVSDFTVGETASSSDKITYATADTSIVQSATATATATSAAISAKGIATFHADDDTLAEKIVATNAGINTGTEAAGATAAFMHGSDAYVFIHDGTTALSANDMLIKLTGIDLTASGSDTIDVATANTIIIT